MKCLVVILSCSILISDVHVQLQDGDTCIHNKNNTGICKPVAQCSTALENLKEKIFPKICGFKGREALTCCVDSSGNVSEANDTIEDVFPLICRSNDENCPILNVTEDKPDVPNKLNTSTSTSNPMVMAGEISKTNDTIENVFPAICRPNDENCTISAVSEVKPDVPSKINTSSNSTRIPGEISQAKCKEYAKYSYRAISSPLLTVKPQYEKLYDCRKKSEILTSDTLYASIDDYPYMGRVGFKSKDNNTKKPIEYLCGGSLISENFVLTVAHCINKSPPVIVRLGVTNVNDYKNEQLIKVAEFHIHPNFTDLYNDIGLLKLEEPVVINKFVRPACLNTVRNINSKTALITGWGLVYWGQEPSHDIFKILVSISSNEVCNDSYKTLTSLKHGVIDDLMFCAGTTTYSRRDPCGSDKGSALQVSIDNSKELQCMSLIIGVASHRKGCTIFRFPDIYTRVSAYIDWIENIVWPENI